MGQYTGYILVSILSFSVGCVLTFKFFMWVGKRAYMRKQKEEAELKRWNDIVSREKERMNKKK